MTMIYWTFQSWKNKWRNYYTCSVYYSTWNTFYQYNSTNRFNNYFSLNYVNPKFVAEKSYIVIQSAYDLIKKISTTWENYEFKLKPNPQRFKIQGTEDFFIWFFIFWTLKIQNAKIFKKSCLKRGSANFYFIWLF